MNTALQEFLLVCTLFVSLNGIAQIANRDYTVGEKLRYRMTGLNRSSGSEQTYTVDSFHTVKTDGETILEEISWVDDEEPGFRQKLSLDLSYNQPFPNPAIIPPHLVGPAFDLLTFYVDYRLILDSKLTEPGDSAYIEHGKPSSWAAGNLLVGEDCLDFEISLEAVFSDIMRFKVQHISPRKGICVKLSAPWMKESVVAGQFNNWVQRSIMMLRLGMSTLR
jgi:hypothetical protein